MYLWIVLPPIIGATIGWLTNYIAIKMLFKPHRPVRVFGYNFQGLIPKRRKEIGRSIARAIERQLLSSNDLADALSGIDLKAEIEQSVEEAIEHRFKSNKIKSIPVIGLVSENLMNNIRYLITRELFLHLDKKKDDIVNRFKESIDVNHLLSSRLDDLELEEFEALLTEFIGKELRHIEWIGGIMGFLIGVVQVILLYFIR
ncbi:MAG: DUF445 domain-containing protein [Thermodesulfobacteriota bacterium]